MDGAIRVGTAFVLMLYLGTCAAGPKASKSKDRPVERCSVTKCFQRQSVRSFDVIDDDTIVVYSGAQRCPFVVEMRGLQCRMSTAPEVNFVTVGPVPAASALETIRQTGGGLVPGSQDPAGIRFRPVDRVCDYTRGLIAVTGPFDQGTRTPVPALGALGDACQVVDIKSVTDDQLIEMFVKNKLVPPPPPVGTGEISVAEPDEQSDAAGTPGEDAAAAEQQQDDEAAPAADDDRRSRRRKKR